MNKNLTFNVAEATELGTHCALHHSYSPQEQKYIFRLDVYNQKQIKWLSARTHTTDNWISMVSSVLKTIYVSRYPTELWKQPNLITTTWRLPLST